MDQHGRSVCALHNAALIDDEQRTHIGDFLLHADGTWSESKGDEDVVHNLDGKRLIIALSKIGILLAYATQWRFLRWSTPSEWLEKSIFPTEMNLTKEYAKIRHLHPL